MRKDLIPDMEEFNAMTKADQIETLCLVHECSEKIKRIHRDQYVNRKWNPHPPQRFVEWWGRDGVRATEKHTDRKWEGVSTAEAFNCEAVREVYREAKQMGVI